MEFKQSTEFSHKLFSLEFDYSFTDKQRLAIRRRPIKDQPATKCVVLEGRDEIREFLSFIRRLEQLRKPS